MNVKEKWKRLTTLFAALALLTAGLPALAQAPGYEAVYASDNPVPAIVRRWSR